jgi:hypothetical protein
MFGLKVYFFIFWFSELLNSSDREKNIIDIDFDHQNDRFLFQIILFDE